MSYPIATYEPEKAEMYDWHHMDIIKNPPYSNYDMVIALAEGKFIIEGSRSDFSDAELYAQHYSADGEVWKALHAVDGHHEELALNGIVY